MDKDYNKSRDNEGGEHRERPNRERSSSFRTERPERSGNRSENRGGEKPLRFNSPQRPEYGQRREGSDSRESGNRYGSDNRGRSNSDYRERNFNRDDQRSASRPEQRNFNRDDQRSFNRPDQRSFGRDDQRHGDRPDQRNFNRDDRGGRNYSSGNDRGERTGYQGNRDEHKSFRPAGERRFSSGGYAGGERTGNNDRRERNYNQDRPVNESGSERDFNRDDRYNREGSGEKKVYKARSSNQEYPYNRERREINDADKEELRQKHYSKKKILAHRLKNENEETELRLNRYISMGGICSRRDADELIKTGRVKVNGVVVQTVGVKVRKKDKVEVDGADVVPERKVYLVLNKPKDYVTTVEDPMERKTVMALVAGACKERVYPVGRLDRQTTGVLLFTNDGDLAKKLTHPKFDHKKIYHVFLDKVVSEQDLQAIAKGVELEDGFIKADDVNYASDDRTEVGIEIHSGKNRIVRRIFEHFGYQIIKLDRVYFAGITKKNVPRGTWRFLTTDEVNVLKYY